LSPARSTYALIASAHSMIRSTASLSRGVIQHHSIAVDPVGERPPPDGRGHEINVPAEELLRVRHKANALGKTEASP